MCIQKYIAKAENGMSRQDLPQLCPDAQILVRNPRFFASFITRSAGKSWDNYLFYYLFTF